jgi:hypothetical protein
VSLEPTTFTDGERYEVGSASFRNSSDDGLRYRL